MENGIQMIGRLEDKKVSYLNKVNSEWKVMKGSYRAPITKDDKSIRRWDYKFFTCAKRTYTVCLGFLPRSNSLVSKPNRLSTLGILAIRHKCRTEIRCSLLHCSLFTKRKRSAFTLAEVLITLGIIGVVAAMTIPTLIQNHQKHVVETRLKKSYSMIYQALKFAESEYGEPKYWDQVLAETELDNSKAFAEKYILPYLKGAEFCDTGMGADGECSSIVGCGGGGVNYKLPDGTMIGICKYPQEILYVNVSPLKQKNIYRNYFQFTLDFNTGKFSPRYLNQNPNITREDCINGFQPNKENVSEPDTLNYIISCNKTQNKDDYDISLYSSHACTALIFLDGWKISDDYPW